jgi:4-hydroxy-3-polyprenylbenzoate decarboxylase
MRKFIKQLESANELIRIKEFVDPVFEIAEITDRISKQPYGGKALLFENTGTKFPVLINSLGSEKRICMALGVNALDEIGTSISNLLETFSTPKGSIWQKLKLLPALKEISSWLPVQKKGKGLCQEIIMLKPELSKLPILKCWPEDGGRFITLPLVNTIDPISHIRNVGMYRMQVFSDNSTGMHWHRHKTGARHYEQYKKLGQKMPVVVVIGGDMSYTYAATAPLPDNIDEYIFAGFLRKKKVELVKCLTQEMWVPSDVDFVIEGYVDPSEPLVWEGPFGDHTGFYSLADWYPMFNVTCITHRKDAIYLATIVGIPPQEDTYIAKATERIFLSPIKIALAPEIIDMNLPLEGVAHNLAIVKINKNFPGQAFKVMNALWGAGQMMFNKVLIVTSEETDIFSTTSVIEACLKNVTLQSHLALQIGPSDVLDHASTAFSLGGKLCIDATRKLPEEIRNSLENNNQVSDINQLKEIIEKYQEIQFTNYEYLSYGIIVCGINKTLENQVKNLISRLWAENKFKTFRCLAFVNDSMRQLDADMLLWLILGNIDPVRDCTILSAETNICVAIDATIKTQALDDFKRDWPSIILSSKETIGAIDQKWSTYNLDTFVSSPSLKFIQNI